MTSKAPRPTRLERKRMNRLAGVRAAVDAGDDIRHMYEAWNFWRAALKRRPVEERAAHRARIAELLVNDAMNALDDTRHLEVAA